VVGVHLVGGLVGTLMIGFFARLDEGTTWAPEGALNGLLYGGGITQLVSQAVVAILALAVSFIGTAIIALLIKVTIGFRVDAEVERNSIDIAEHGEAAYEDA
jgi:Amt family ammonium transporter